MTRALVTGGSGFLGSALCRELLAAGQEVRVLDDHSRGRPARLEGMEVEIVTGDVRDPDAVHRAAQGCEVVWHLAYVNGTRFFYEKPDLVLDVGIKGALNTIEAAVAAGARRYVLASTSETYQEPTHVPTTEIERLIVPDVKNPRYSYGGGKIASELLALHLAARRGLEVVVFRPHNFYGPDMGFEHVVPEITERIVKLSNRLADRRIALPIQGDGSDTRSFCFVSDGARGAFLAGERGAPGEIYHVGTEREVSIKFLVEEIGRVLGVELAIQPGPAAKGGTSRRCPAIGKLAALGYRPEVDLEEGLARTVPWYRDHFLGARA
jgi:nucleoside-diphosphate-sugar epimerase